ncbi:MAG TPA: GNAT family N-acetyltransferase [Microvirga sp.]|nr:GNAT family N-acetyltransferase [Microvirga sp.]
MQISLSTPRLALRPLVPADLDPLVSLLAEPGVRRFLCDDRVLPRETVADILGRALAAGASGLGLWVMNLANAPWIGVAGVQPVADEALAQRAAVEGYPEIVVARREAAWGQGFAAEALTAVLAHGFAQLRLPRIVAFADEPNVRSHALLTRVGFRHVGAVPGLRNRLLTYEIEPQRSA